MSRFRQLLSLIAEGNQEYYPDSFMPGVGIDENTLLMLHGNEYKDVSDYNCAVTNSNTTIVTDVVKFKSAFKNTVAQSSSYYIHAKLPKKLTSVFTVDFWFNPTSYSPTYGAFFTIGTRYSNGMFFQLIDSYNIIDMYVCGTQGTTSLKDKVPLNKWTHWALVGDGTKVVLYINGKNVIQWSGAKNIQQDDVYIFKTKDYGRSVPGYFEEIRVSDVARWTEDFEPPTRPYGTAAPPPQPDVVTYTMIDYLHFTGTQYIDTNYALWKDRNWKMEYTFSVDQHYDWNNMWGFDDIEDINNEAWIYSTGRYNIRVGGLSKQDVGYISPLTKHTVVHDNTGTVLNTTIDGGTAVNNGSRANTNATNTLCFGHRLGGAYFLGKLYEIKFWSNGTLVRHLVPAINDVTSTGGLYDTIEGKFYPNAGSGEFIYGYTDGTNTYTPVSYLQSTGVQYINTGVAPTTKDTMVEVQYAFINNKGTGFDSIIGSRRSNSTGRFYPVSCDGTSKVRHVMGDTTLTSQYDLGQVHTVIFNNSAGKCIVDGGEVGSVGTSFNTHTYPMYLFGLNMDGGFQYASISRIYYCKIWQNNTLVRDFVPCKAADNTPGFFDRVTSTFYTNSGSGTFTIGQEG